MSAPALSLPPVESVHGDQDELLSLAEACNLKEIKNRFKPATLRAEYGRGRLTITRVGRQQFVTRRDIKEMLRLCREQKARASGSGQKGEGQTVTSGRPHGSSSTESGISPQAALQAKLDALKKPSPTTSAPSTSRRAALVR